MKRFQRWVWRGIGLPVLVGIGLLSLNDALRAEPQHGVSDHAAPATAVPAIAFPKSGPPPTFAKDVERILQAKCQKCHQPGSLGPMSLLEYEKAKAYAPKIKRKVLAREMPPWPIDKTIGIQEFENDQSLSDKEIETIVRWVEAGAPLGNPADRPAPVKWPDWVNTWRYEERFGRPPDLVVQSPKYTVTANGMDQFPTLSAKIEGLAKERWIRAIEIKPGNPESRYVFHHANPNMTQDGRTSGLIASAVGTEGQVFPSDAGKLIKPGAVVGFNMHFWPYKLNVDAVMMLGLWFYPDGEKPQFSTPGQVQHRADMTSGAGGYPGYSKVVARRGDLLIPPGGKAMFRSTFVLTRPARIHDLRGHMHLRGKYQILEAVYPDGRSEVINKLNWNHGWHTTFVYAEHARPLLPKGTVLITTSVFDNSKDNHMNPDPDQWVVAGSRTVDEMSHFWIGMTYFDKEEDFQRLVSERDRFLAERKRNPDQPATLVGQRAQ